MRQRQLHEEEIAMKGSTGRLIASLLLVSVFLCAALMTADAASSGLEPSDPDAFQATSAKVSKGSKALVLRMVFTNAGDVGILEFGVALAFSDKNKERVFAFPNTPEGYIDEVCYWVYTPDEVIPPGETYRTEDSFADYLSAATVDVAIRYYEKENGEFVNIPESEWLWFRSGVGFLNENPDRSYYLDPDAAVFELSDTVSLGYHYYLLDEYNTAFYGHSQGGEWIDEVEIGSLAETAGLMAGDLILAADGVKTTENVFAVNYAMARIAEGNSVELTYERDGSIHTLSLSLEN
jgi:hypothetical protein